MFTWPSFRQLQTGGIIDPTRPVYTIISVSTLSLRANNIHHLNFRHLALVPTQISIHADRQTFDALELGRLQLQLGTSVNILIREHVETLRILRLAQTLHRQIMALDALGRFRDPHGDIRPNLDPRWRVQHGIPANRDLEHARRHRLSERKMDQQLRSSG